MVRVFTSVPVYSLVKWCYVGSGSAHQELRNRGNNLLLQLTEKGSEALRVGVGEG